MSFKCFSFLLLWVAVSPILVAQPSDTITANPNAVKLRKIWMVRGSTNGGDGVGSGLCALGDIFGTGYAAWAVHFEKAHQVRVYAGGPEPLSTEPVRVFDSSGFIGGYGVVGDFWGTGHKAMTVASDYSDTLHHAVRSTLAIYRTEENKIADTAAVIWDSGRLKPEFIDLVVSRILAADLDGDGADEMIAVGLGTRNDVGFIGRGEIWIYKGGAGFQVDTPTVIVRDDEANDNSYRYNVSVGDFDGDGKLDLAIGARYGDQWKLKFYWSDQNNSFSWSQPRIVEMTPGHPAIYSPFVTLDCDGDHVADLLLNGVELYRSGSGKDVHTREFTFADADQHFERYGSNYPEQCPYLNDSSNRYQMVAVSGPSKFNAQSGMLMLFSGGPDGPDHAYDAYYDGVLDGLIEGSVFAYVQPIGDCNGDGWPDVLVSDPQWYNYTGLSDSPGIALILAGGPYIPRDSSTLDVRDVAVAGREAGLSYWPNPLRDELHIAWRGDLKQMPAVMEVHDLLGRLIDRQPLNSWSGASRWDCSAITTGTYLLSIFDSQRGLIAITTLLKQ